jgi:hypothetical protein
MGWTIILLPRGAICTNKTFIDTSALLGPSDGLCLDFWGQLRVLGSIKPARRTTRLTNLTWDLIVLSRQSSFSRHANIPRVVLHNIQLNNQLSRSCLSTLV